jgi:hypothetical protein
LADLAENCPNFKAAQARESLIKGRISTIDLLVLIHSFQGLLIKNLYISSLQKPYLIEEVNSTEPPPFRKDSLLNVSPCQRKMTHKIILFFSKTFSSFKKKKKFKIDVRKFELVLWCFHFSILKFFFQKMFPPQQIYPSRAPNVTPLSG